MSAEALGLASTAVLEAPVLPAPTLAEGLGRAEHGARSATIEPNAAGALDRLDLALAALALADAGARLLGQPAAPSWRARAEERFDVAERAGVTEAALTALLREHGQVT